MRRGPLWKFSFPQLVGFIFQYCCIIVCIFRSRVTKHRYSFRFTVVTVLLNLFWVWSYEVCACVQMHHEFVGKWPIIFIRMNAVRVFSTPPKAKRSRSCTHQTRGLPRSAALHCVQHHIGKALGCMGIVQLCMRFIVMVNLELDQVCRLSNEGIRVDTVAICILAHAFPKMARLPILQPGPGYTLSSI